MVLTIAIPTYNRASLLDLNLKHLFSQIKKEYYDDLEIIVSNNCSSDNTAEVVEKYLNHPFPNLIYHNHACNIGADANIAQAFSRGKGDFILILGDDDLLIDGALDKIYFLLGKYKKCGIIHLEHFGFAKDHIKEMPPVIKEDYFLYKTLKPFINKVNYNFSFLSGNIINKKLLESKFDVELFLGSKLNQLNWTFHALSLSAYNIYVPGPLIAMKTENTGGYGFCEIFGKNFNMIMEYFSKGILKESDFNYLKSALLSKFFPGLIFGFKDKPAFIKENYFKQLSTIYKGRLRFWLFCVPIIVLPKPAGKIYLFFNKVFNKLDHYTTIRFIEYTLLKSGKLIQLKFELE